MKKFLVILVIFSLICSFSANFGVSADNNVYNRVVSTTIETFDDGSYVIITLYEDVPFDQSADMPARATAETKSGSKTARGYNSDGELNWTFTLNASFSYGSGSSTCTATSYSYTIPNSAWSLDSATTSKSGNTAYGTAEFVNKFWFITIDRDTCSLTLSCSPSGVLS